MGYSTDFYGWLSIEPPLEPNKVAYINKFADTRRMKRNAEITKTRPDPIREAVGLPVGIDGEYFVGAGGMAGQEWNSDEAPDVLDHNGSPRTQPGLWCQWVVSEDGKVLEWDGGEKFYEYTEWLVYLIQHFFQPWGHVLDGDIEWQGEDRDDRGIIMVRKNKVAVKQGRVVFSGKKVMVN